MHKNSVGRNRAMQARREKKTATEYVDKIVSGDRFVLSQAITLVESNSLKHKKIADDIVSGCLKIKKKETQRIGITGVPGVGKSTFIDCFGMHLIGEGHKVAVLAVDPTSDRTKGSILGDKTRMEKLSLNDNAYVRPSPAQDSLGGVARKTRESIILCEACGFDVIIVETVGVGQSETAVHSMVDFFLLLLLTNAGDDLQGIKRGIMEMADAATFTKTDGDNIISAGLAATNFQGTLNLFPRMYNWHPKVTTCSALKKEGIEDIWNVIKKHTYLMQQAGFFRTKRKQQEERWLHEIVMQKLKDNFYNCSEVVKELSILEKDVCDGNMLTTMAAEKLIYLYQCHKNGGEKHV